MIQATCNAKGNKRQKPCNRELSLVKSDLFLTEFYAPNIAGMPVTKFVSFECPHCGTITDIRKAEKEDEKLPEYVKWVLKKENRNEANHSIKTNEKSWEDRTHRIKIKGVAVLNK